MSSLERLRKVAAFWGLSLFVYQIGQPPAFAAEAVSVTDAPVHVGSYQLGISTSMRAQQGQFDPYGVYQSYPDGSSAYSVSTQINGSYRLSREWEAELGFSLRKTEMTFPSGSMSGLSGGAPLFDIKYHVGGWSHLVFHLGGAPSLNYKSTQVQGNPMASLSEDFGDGNGAGASVHLGAGGSHSFRRIRIASDVTVIVPFAQEQVPNDGPLNATPVSIRQGNRFQLSQGIAYSFSDSWSVNGGIKESWGESTTSDGQAVLGTMSRLFSANLGASYNAGPSWRWIASYESAYPFYAYAVNQSYSPAVMLGFMYSGI